jgi:hypothetical protein
VIELGALKVSLVRIITIAVSQSRLTLAVDHPSLSPLTSNENKDD